MSTHSPGQYHVLLFDRVGSRIGRRKAECFTDAMASGHDAQQAAECHSYVVVRVLHNSLMPHRDNWDVKESGGERHDR